jgi:glycerophosphoryl diester phosphodiesterase
MLLTAQLSIADDWNVRDHITLTDFTIQSHRGAGNLSAENSVEAFDIAWNWATIPEADIRMTKDGVIVAFHDNNFKRILPNASAETQAKGIVDLTIDEVKKLDIGAWKGEKFAGQRVPTMKEICEILKQNPKRRMYIDIKQIDFTLLAKETEGVHPQLILASTKYEEITQWKKLAPTSKTLHWMGAWGKDKERMEEILSDRLKKLEETNFAGIDQLQIHVYTNPDGTILPNEEFLRKAGEQLRKHKILFQALPWQGEDPKIYIRLMELGVASFATDYPDIASKTVKEYYDGHASK